MANDLMMSGPSLPRRFPPAPDEPLVLFAILGSEHISDGHLIGGRRLKPRPFGTSSFEYGLRCVDEPLRIQTVFEPVAEADEMDRNRLPLPPLVLPGMLGCVNVDPVAMDAPVGWVLEIKAQQLPKRRPAPGRRSDVGVRHACFMRGVS